MAIFGRGLAGVVLLSSCAVGPDYHPVQPSAPLSFGQLDKGDAPVTNDGAPHALWVFWQDLGDPLLPQFVEEALAASPKLRLAQARLREARARRAMASGALYPSLTASGSAGRRAGLGEGGAPARDQFAVGFDASWELDVFGGGRRAVEAAAADYEAFEASLEDTQVSLVAEVARGYFEVRLLQVRLAIARRNLESQTETYELAALRAGAGLASEQDVAQATAIREQTRAYLPSLEVGLVEAEHRLDILLGLNPGTSHARLSSAQDLPKIPAAIAVGIPAEALRRRPDVRAAERRLAAATARVGVATAALYPSLRLSGTLGLEALSLAGLGDGAFYSLLGGLVAPIFQGGRLRAQLLAQDAVREQELIAYEQTVLAALAEAESALITLARNREREEALARATEAAKSAALFATQRYGAGVIDFQSVLDTERNVLALEDSLASARADGVFALIRLYKALGGGFGRDLEETAR